MLRHVIMWRFKDGFGPEENAQNARLLKQRLEALRSVIDDISYLKVHIGPLPQSNADVLLDAGFDDEAALQRYIQHPAHQEVVGLLRQMLDDRHCMDVWDDVGEEK